MEQAGLGLILMKLTKRMLTYTMKNQGSKHCQMMQGIHSDELYKSMQKQLMIYMYELRIHVSIYRKVQIRDKYATSETC